MTALHVLGRAERNLLRLILTAEADGREALLASAHRSRYAVVTRYADNKLVGRRDGATARGTVDLLRREGLVDVEETERVLSTYAWQRPGDAWRGRLVTVTDAGRAVMTS